MFLISTIKKCLFQAPSFVPTRNHFPTLNRKETGIIQDTTPYTRYFNVYRKPNWRSSWTGLSL